jgi:hypothetical protein
MRSGSHDLVQDDCYCLELTKMRAPIKSPPYADKENYRAKILSTGECEGFQYCNP